MKLGMGLYRHMLTPDNFRFAKQAGCTHIVAHWTDYFNSAPELPSTIDADTVWGVTENQDKPWDGDELNRLRIEIENHGLKLAAIENFDPSHWFDILLDGPKKEQQYQTIKQNIRAVGAAGIPIIGYNFSLAGVWGHESGPFGRGEATTVRFKQTDPEAEPRIPNGQIWNMIYNPELEGFHDTNISESELWARLEGFLKEMLPVAEECGVKLALHPDDPPVERLRGMPRLVRKQGDYRRLLSISNSPSNAIELCLGSIQEMEDGDAINAIEEYGPTGSVGYVHLRNVSGKVPAYTESFIDDGDIDVLKAARVLKEVGFEGVIIPDHAPSLNCDASWHAGMAFALGYLKAAIGSAESN